MQTILDRFDAAPEVFRPRSVPECFALALAKRLGDVRNISQYVKLCGVHSRGKLAAAYQKTVSGGQHPAQVEQFREDLAGNLAEVEIDDSKVLALKVERRTVAVAGFTGDRLDFTRILHLSSGRDRAFECAINFLSRTLVSFRPDSAAIEITDDEDTQRAELVRTLVAVLKGHFLPVWSVAKKLLFDAFAYPAVRTRNELRETAGHIWPLPLNGGVHSLERDAAMLGLWVYLQRPFMCQQLTVPA